VDKVGDETQSCNAPVLCIGLFNIKRNKFSTEVLRRQKCQEKNYIKNPFCSVADV
jgi:hypothetical protein